MDLRKYSKKYINTQNVLNYEYIYYSNSSSEYGRPCLNITIEKDEETATFPSYAIMIKFDHTGKTTDIMRLQVAYGTGRLIKKFPPSVEEKAEYVLRDIIIPASCKDTSDLSILLDKCQVDNP